MINIYKKIVITSILILAIAVPGTAVELDLYDIGFPIEVVDVHGFFSQGYMISAENDVVVGSEDGTLDLREYGINFAGYLTDDIMLAAQIMGYTVGKQGDDDIDLHYGLIDWRMDDRVGVRAGRYRVPAGFYNETRDVDMLRSSVFLPQTIYSENYRDYFSACDGITLYGTLNLNDLGYLQYQVGTGNVVAKENPSGDIAYNATFFGVTKVEADNAKSSNMQLVWETPLDGFRAGYTWRRVDVEMLLHDYIFDHPLLGPIRIDATESQDNKANHVYSLEYMIDRLTLMYEYNLQRKASIDQSIGWYVGANYEISDNLSVGCYYTELDITDGNTNEAESDVHSYSLFTKYNINYSWLIKAQVDFNEGHGTSQWPTKLNADNDGDSTMFSIKTTLAF